MKTPEEIKKIKEGLKSCSSDECHGEHGDCPYKNNVFCMMTMAGEAMAYIEQLEERISLMMIQMHGDCGCCKHFGPVVFKSETEPITKDCLPAVCQECMDDDERLNWEYKGLSGDD